MHRDSDQNRFDSDIEKILVAGDPFRGYLEMITSAFLGTGINAVSFEFESYQRNPVTYLQECLSRDRMLDLYREGSMRNGIALERAIARESPDYVLVLNGARLQSSAITNCRKANLKLALWAYDSIRNFPEIAEIANDFDLVYTYEPDDLPLFPGSCWKKYLPMAYDSRLYHPKETQNATREADICFVGTLDLKYGPRSEMLQRVVSQMKDKHVVIWAQDTPWYSPFRLQDTLLILANSDVTIKRKTRSHEEINNLYNNSRICLNVHHSQSRRALNPRTFEILGGGGFLLTDRSLADLSDFQLGRDYVIYSGVNDLIDKATTILDDEKLRKRVELSGHSVARSAHTYSSRAKTILLDLRKNR